VKDFLKEFLFGNGLLAIAVGAPGHVKYHTSVPETLPTDTDVFFGPAMRKRKGETKEDMLGTKVLWVDVDDEHKPLFTLPPSMMVQSGHGWHLYWVLDEPLEKEVAEHLNKQLIADISTADPACYNINRVLRVPGSTNTKEPIRPVTLATNTGVVYTKEDITLLENLNKKVRHKIRTGDSRGYRSRSERDWSIITSLVGLGARDELIYLVFQHQPCGDKARESADKYLERTIQKARESGEASPNGTGGEDFEEKEDGYYFKQGRRVARVSTFVITPTLLLDGHAFETQDAIVGDVTASGFTWNNITFTRSAFTSVHQLDRETPVVAWQWLGHDGHVRALLPYLLGKLQDIGLPRVVASSTLGLHLLNGKYYFLGDTQILSADDLWEGYNGPIAWLSSHKEHPKLQLTPSVDEEALAVCRTLLPLINEPEVLWPAVGWYAAACVKPWLESKGYRFPTLSVVGTKGSGKTTLLQRILMPLFGQKECKSYDSGTTRFVILALLGSSNAVPIAFSEFRYESVESFLRYVLLAYDTGHDPRGRPDQTTVDYPLSAPFSLDGEDLIADPAARERIVTARLDPNAVQEGTEAYRAYNELRWKIPETFGGYFIQRTLGLLATGELDTLLLSARDAVFEAFPQRMPDRIRNNHIVAYFGARLVTSTLGLDDPDPQTLSRSINTVYNVAAGRSRTMVDDMVEDIVNACSTAHTASFKWEYVKEDAHIYFQLSSAHSWWLASRRRQGRSALERDALRSQLQEAPYALPQKSINGVWMFGVDLKKAQDLGLDVPDHLKVGQFTLRF
jgi:hypothetical protein